MRIEARTIFRGINIRGPSILARLRDEIEKYTDVTVTLDLHPHRLRTNDEQVVFIVKTPRPSTVAGSIVGGKRVCLSAHALCNLIVPMPERREF